ncbi:MAG: tripartite tricarboxylate transporter TctB family protein [Proteobacteria bacterium]|nr:tripartite tricarboxylate transporter TctB family protein [Pseudomonadota bacterium]
MAEPPDAPKSEQKAIGGELIIPIAALVFAFYYFYTIIDVPWTAQVSAFFVGSILVALVLLYLVRAAAMLRRGEANLSMSTLISPADLIPKRLKLLVLTIGYIALVRFMGFTITTFLFLLLSMLVLGDGKRKRLILLIALIMSLGGYLLFIVAFKTRFPLGPFEAFMNLIF